MPSSSSSSASSSSSSSSLSSLSFAVVLGVGSLSSYSSNSSSSATRIYLFWLSMTTREEAPMIAVVLVFIPTEDGRRASGSEFGTACMVGGVKDLRLRGPAGQTDFLRGLPPTTTM
jgi:hypothetical protein